MRVAIIRNELGLSDYIAEILRTWGLPLFDGHGLPLYPLGLFSNRR